MSKATEVKWLMKKNVRWNGEECAGRRVVVRVGHISVRTWWCADLEGTERKAVEVSYGGQRFFLDNEDGEGWKKVTWGLGSPSVGHKSLPDNSVVIRCDHFSPESVRGCVFCGEDVGTTEDRPQSWARSAVYSLRDQIIVLRVENEQLKSDLGASIIRRAQDYCHAIGEQNNGEFYDYYDGGFNLLDKLLVTFPDEQERDPWYKTHRENQTNG